MQHVGAPLLGAKTSATRPSPSAGPLARLMASDISSHFDDEGITLYIARHSRDPPGNKLPCLRLTSDLREWVLRTAHDACKGWMIS